MNTLSEIRTSYICHSLFRDRSHERLLGAFRFIAFLGKYRSFFFLFKIWYCVFHEPELASRLSSDYGRVEFDLVENKVIENDKHAILWN